MVADQKEHGPRQEGVHRGIRWSAVLTQMTYSPRDDSGNNKRVGPSYWCGYVHLDRDVSEEDTECMNEHVECTYDQGKTMGFDCAHAWDLSTGCLVENFHVQRL